MNTIMQSAIPITCPKEILLGLHKDAQQFAALLKEQSAMALFREGRLSSGMAASGGAVINNTHPQVKPCVK